MRGDQSRTVGPPGQKRQTGAKIIDRKKCKERKTRVWTKKRWGGGGKRKKGEGKTPPSALAGPGCVPDVVWGALGGRKRKKGGA